MNTLKVSYIKFVILITIKLEIQRIEVILVVFKFISIDCLYKQIRLEHFNTIIAKTKIKIK